MPKKLTHGRVLRRNTAFLRRHIPQEMGQRLLNAGLGLRAQIEADLAGGETALEPDTHTLGKSIAVQATGPGIAFDDYDERRAAAEAAYTGGDSRWEQVVRERLGVDAYNQEHFEQRMAEAPPPPAADGLKTRVRVVTGWWPGLGWELGHTNPLTRQEEHRPWMLPAARQWRATQLLGYLAGMLRTRPP